MLEKGISQAFWGTQGGKCDRRLAQTWTCCSAPNGKCCTAAKVVPKIWAAKPRHARHPPHPIVSQLQTDLYEGVGADAELLDASLPKFGEGEHVAVHVGGQRLGHRQRAAHLSLHLRGGKGRLSQGKTKGGIPHPLHPPHLPPPLAGVKHNSV